MSIEVKCPHCGRLYSVEREHIGERATCSCGAVIELSPGSAGAGPPPVEQVAPPPTVDAKTCGLAIASFILGLCSICGGILTALPAIILGIVALSKIRASGGRLRGGGFAVAGMAIGGSLTLITFLLMLLLMPALSRAREQGKRAVCLSNLRSLQLGWLMYADDNDGRLVNGVAGIDRSVNGGAEKAWVARDWADGYQGGQSLWQNEQKMMAIRDGWLFPYVATDTVYRCPSGDDGHVRTYSIVDSMNGIAREGTDNVRGAFAKKRTDLYGSSPAYRIVFVDVGFTQPETYAVHYAKPMWFDPPPARHGDGTSFSFADGHCEYHRWKGAETIRHARDAAKTPGSDAFAHWPPSADDSKEDLQWIQKACWGQLGY